ncbi:MAG: BatA domain-containing protein [Planctomycetota bacterium]
MFLNPLFLIGSLAAGVPLAIHLMHRREGRTVAWPSLRFLKASDRRTARRRQVEQLLLLILRMALMAFLSVALSRPVIRAWGVGGGGETAAVIVLDNSMSMSAPAAKSTRFARAKRAADELLKGLPEGSWVALRLADGSEPEGAHALTKNSGAVAAALRAASVGDARGDMGAAVAGAIVDVAASSAASREVHVLTDMQAAAFARAPLAARAGRAVQVVFTDCGGEVDVRVRSFSPVDEERKCVLEVDVPPGKESADGKGESAGAEGERAVRLAPRGSSGFSFQFAVDRPGDVTGRVYLSPADGIPDDDVRYFRVHLAERIPVLVIERGRSRVAAARPSFFVATALDPARLSGGGARSAIVPKVTTPAYLAGKTTRELVRESPVAVLADLGAMDEAEARAWVAYVRAGGTLVAFPSAAGGLDEGAAALGGAAGVAFLPAEVGAPKGDASSDRAPSGGARPEPRRIDVESADFAREDVLEPFRDLEPTLRAVTVRRAYDLRATHAAGGRSVLDLEGGGAFLAARRFGEGEVFLFAVPAGTEWSDLPARSLFLPLVHALVYRAAAPRNEERSFIAGTGARVTLPPEAGGRTVRLVEPSGRRTDIAATVKGDGAGGGMVGTAPAAEVSIGRLARSGVYRLEGDAIPRGISLVANPDPEESDPARTGLSRMRELYLGAAGAEPVFVEDPSGLGKAVARIRKGLELWDYLLFMVLSVALFECFYANRLAAGTKGKGAAKSNARPAPAASP